jgi:NAD(P) transhydrogenase
VNHAASFSDSKKSAKNPEPPAIGIPYGKLTVGVPKESMPLERRVAQTPESVAKLVASGFQVNKIRFC